MGAVSGHGPNVAGTSIRTRMGVGQLSKTTVPIRTGGILGQFGPRANQCARDLPLGDLTEKLGELLNWDTAPAGQHKKQGKERPRTVQVTVPASICVDQSGDRPLWTSL